MSTETDRDPAKSPGENGEERTGGPHFPVLCAEVMDALAIGPESVLVDATFGNGGYSRAMLEAGAGFVIAFDRDPAAAVPAARLEQDFPDRFRLVRGCFSSMDRELRRLPEAKNGIDGAAFDLGVSSMQLDQAERGFSFRFDGPLDMRMGQAADAEASAADLVNTLEEAALADIFHAFGEETAARRVARAVVAAREEQEITRTGQLADIIRAVTGGRRKGGAGGRGGGSKIDPATRSFQALRMMVNDEAGEMVGGIAGAVRHLRPGGRLAVVAFHSLEDRFVKNFMRKFSGQEARPSRHMPGLPETGPEPCLDMVKRGAIKPGKEEESINPRSRSARLRVAERSEAPLPEELAGPDLEPVVTALLPLTGIPEHGLRWRGVR